MKGGALCVTFFIFYQTLPSHLAMQIELTAILYECLRAGDIQVSLNGSVLAYVLRNIVGRTVFAYPESRCPDYKCSSIGVAEFA